MYIIKNNNFCYFVILLFCYLVMEEVDISTLCLKFCSKTTGNQGKKDLSKAYLLASSSAV